MTMVRIEAIRCALPARVETNEDLAKDYPDWGFDRLEARTGVRARHIAALDETAVDLAQRACEELFADEVIAPQDVDGIIFCTETPDYLLPQNSAVLHGRLELGSDVLAFDINLGCSGYPYGLEVSRALIAGGAARNVLFITADTYSKIIHPGDRATRVLFGDGAAVSLLSPSPDQSGIIDVSLHTSGKQYDRFIVPAGGTRRPASAETAETQIDRSGNVRSAENIVMNGMGVLSFFNSVIPDNVEKFIARNDLLADQIDFFVFHQASATALDALQKRLNIPDDKMLRDMADTGNLVSASIPTVLQRALADGRIGRSALVLLCGFGVGLSWGSVLVRT